jgi:small nuclear ribonucleoprotein (snRNP)-like protein
MEDAAPWGEDAPRKKARKVRDWRTLGVICQALVGASVVLELKNDAEVSGVVFESDMAMNMTLSSADHAGGVRYTSSRGCVSTHSEIFVKGTMLRYVHIPSHVDIPEALTQHLRVLDLAAASYKRQMLPSK